jgi:hypothetical protein
MNLDKTSFMPEEKHLHLFTQADNFNYAQLDSKIRILVQQHTNEIKEQLKDTVQAIWQIGQKLVEVRNCLSYGEFNSWLKTEFQWSRSTAYNYINVFETFGSCPNFGQLNIAASALYLLAAPSTSKEAREEALESARLGEVLTYSKAKAIVSSHKKSSQPKNNDQSINIAPSVPALEKKSFTAVKLNLKPDCELDKTVTTVVVKSLEQRGEDIVQSQVDDLKLGTDVCELTSNNNQEELAKNLATQAISLNSDDICQLLIVNVNYLTDEEIISVWQAIAHRIPDELRSSAVEID